MNEFGLKFHHFGLATQNPSLAGAFLQGLGYRVSETVFDPEQNVNLRLATHSSQPWVELVYAAGTEGPLSNILKGSHSLIYHMCYEAESPISSLEKMHEHGHRVFTVSPPKPALLFDGKKVSFHMVRGVGLMEILHNV